MNYIKEKLKAIKAWINSKLGDDLTQEEMDKLVKYRDLPEWSFPVKKRVGLKKRHTFPKKFEKLNSRTIKTIIEEKKVPLKKSASKAAFKENISTSVKEGKPVKQAVAIAYAEKNAAKKTKPKRV